MVYIAANFKTELSAPSDSFKQPTSVKNIKNDSDRELFLGLFDNPINLLLLHKVPLFVGENSPMLHLQINEAVLKWREGYERPPV